MPATKVRFAPIFSNHRRIQAFVALALLA